MYAVDELEARSKWGVVENRCDGFGWDGGDFRTVPSVACASVTLSDAFRLFGGGSTLTSPGGDGGRAEDIVSEMTSGWRKLSRERLINFRFSLLLLGDVNQRSGPSATPQPYGMPRHGRANHLVRARQPTLRVAAFAFQDSRVFLDVREALPITLPVSQTLARVARPNSHILCRKSKILSCERESAAIWL